MIRPHYRAVVQEIKISWCKNSRGGIGAIQRNSIAQALALPLDKATKENWFLFEHQAFYNEQNNFGSPIEYVGSYTSYPLFSLRHLDIVFEEQQVGVIWAHEVLGGPIYIPVHKKVFILRPGEWGQILYNYRDGHNSYEKRVINIGMFTNIDKDIFISEAPTYSFNKIAALY